MSLTPEDIYNKEFKRKFSLRAYDSKEIDEFLDVVATYYEETLAENKRLKEEVDRMKDKLNNWENLESSLNETISKADQIVNEKKEEATKEASLIIKKAQLEAEEIINDAQKKVDEEYKLYQELLEHERLFKIRFKTLLKSHLEMLQGNTEMDLTEAKEDLTYEE